MHGIILYEFSRFAEERIGADAWRDVLRGLGLHREAFTPVKPEPDERVLRIIQALAQARATPLDELLRDFGKWIAPHLLATYAPMIPREWVVSDILENVEDVIHRTVRLRDPSATPPALVSKRRDDGTISIVYRSERGLCHFATGLIQGIALSYGQTATVQQATCMHSGAPQCEFVIRLG